MQEISWENVLKRIDKFDHQLKDIENLNATEIESFFAGIEHDFMQGNFKKWQVDFVRAKIEEILLHMNKLKEKIHHESQVLLIQKKQFANYSKTLSFAKHD